MGTGTLFCVTVPAVRMIRHRSEDVRAVDPITLGAKYEVVARRAPRCPLDDLDIGHAVLREEALLWQQ